MAATYKIVGLAGLAGSGKDTAASVLVDKGWHQIAFADPVRQGLYALNPIISLDYGRAPTPEGVTSSFIRLAFLVDALGWDAAKQHADVRSLLQRFGTEAGRDIHGDRCWIDLFENEIRKSRKRKIVATDVRFPNESEFIYGKNGVVLRITRKYVPRMSHRSEQPDKLPQAVDIANTTLDQLKHDVLDAVSTHFGI